MSCKNAVIFANLKREGIAPVFEDLKLFLENRKIVVNLVDLSGNETDSFIEYSSENTDFAVCLGGDGTVLTCAKILSKSKIPVLGIKKGTFGFITEAVESDYKGLLIDFLESKAVISERKMGSVYVIRNKKNVFESVFLNEAVVHNGLVKMKINESDMGLVRSDGVIVSTSTGSTAYNLSAGGPIVHTDLDTLVINSICPFSLGFRPFVLGSDAKIEIKINREEKESKIVCDGHSSFELHENDAVYVSYGDAMIRFIHNGKISMMDKVRDKLLWSGEVNVRTP